MYGLDPPTLVFVVSFLALLLAMVMFAMCAGFPRTVQGIRQWATAIPLFVGSTVLFSQQQSHPFFHVILANTLILLGVLYMGWGMLAFYERPVPRARSVAIALALLVGTLAWYTFVRPLFHVRLAVMSITLSALFAYLCWLPLRYGRRSLGSIITSLAFTLTAVSCLFRMVTVTAQLDQPTGLLDFGTLQVLYLASFNVSLLIGAVGFILMANERLRTILEFNASHDALTGTLNRGAFFQVATAQFEKSQATGTPCSVVLLDLDHFKLINDLHGHAVGDLVLQDFCRSLRTVLRPIDTLGRYGGEEFVILLPGMTHNEAAAMAHRLRAAIQPSPSLPRYTVSIGFSTLTPSIASIDELLIGADKALYRAKKNGRNRIEAWVWGAEDHDDPFCAAFQPEIT